MERQTNGVSKKSQEIEMSERRPPAPSKDSIPETPSRRTSVNPQANVSIQSKALNFLSKVANNKYDAVLECLKEDVKIAFFKTDFEDPTGRFFTEISGFQYSLWSLNLTVWQAIIKQSEHDSSIKNQIAEQITEVAKSDSTHTMHFNLDPLINALNDYIQFEESLCNFLLFDRKNRLLNQIKTQQKLLPICIAEVFCSNRPYPTAGNNFNWEVPYKNIRTIQHQNQTLDFYNFLEKTESNFVSRTWNNTNSEPHAIAYNGDFRSLRKDSEFILQLFNYRKEKLIDLLSHYYNTEIKNSKN